MRGSLVIDCCKMFVVQVSRRAGLASRFSTSFPLAFGERCALFTNERAAPLSQAHSTLATSGGRRRRSLLLVAVFCSLRLLEKGARKCGSAASSRKLGKFELSRLQVATRERTCKLANPNSNPKRRAALLIPCNRTRSRIFPQRERMLFDSVPVPLGAQI